MAGGLLRFLGATAITGLFAAALAQESEPPKTLVPGKGSELTTARCATCHDAQHITRTRLSRGEWEYNIRNMIERGAPIAAQEIPVILEYLATYYNRDQPPPPPDPAAAGYGLDGGSGAPAVHALVSAHACIACHGLEQRIVGPSFREVAARYAGEDAAAARLVRKIKQGGAGTWGNVPMPPHPGIADSELDRMVAWILEQR